MLSSYFIFSDGVLLKTFLDLGSNRISDVVDAYEHALCARCPRARYVVGFDARYLFLPMTALPEWLSDWITDFLQTDKPIPAILEK